jgi:hypothetical protein
VIRIDTGHATELACPHEPDARELAIAHRGITSPSLAPSLPLQVLANGTHNASSQVPERRPTLRRSTPHAEAAALIAALFVKAEKQARRQGFIGPRIPGTPKGRVGETPRSDRGSAAPSNRLDRPSAGTLDVASHAMLAGALKGTGKFRKLPEPERDHIFKMLEANDLPGLAAVVDAGNPLRSFSTGLKVGRQLLDRRGAENLPPALREPLMRLGRFYADNPQLVALGDARAFSPERVRSASDVRQLRDGFGQADVLLDELERALRD